MKIALEIGRCDNACRCGASFLGIVYGQNGHRFGQRLIGCGGPYRSTREVPGHALSSLREARAADLPVRDAHHLARLQRDAQDAIARLILDGSIRREDGEAFLDEVFP